MPPQHATLSYEVSHAKLHRQNTQFCQAKFLSAPDKPANNIAPLALVQYMYPQLKACVPFPPHLLRLGNHTMSTYFSPSLYTVTDLSSRFTFPWENSTPVKLSYRGNIACQQRLRSIHGLKSKLKPRRHRKISTKRVRRKRIRAHRRSSSAPSMPKLHNMTQPPTESSTTHSRFPETSSHEQSPMFHMHTSPPSRTPAGERDGIFQELDQYGSMFGRLVRDHHFQALEFGTSDRNVPGVLESTNLEDFDQYGSMRGRISRSPDSEALQLVTSDPTGELNNLNLEEAGEYGTLFGRSCSELLEPCTPGRDGAYNMTRRLVHRDFSGGGVEGSVKFLQPERHSIEAILSVGVKDACWFFPWPNEVLYVLEAHCRSYGKRWRRRSSALAKDFEYARNSCHMIPVAFAILKLVP